MPQVDTMTVCCAFCGALVKIVMSKNDVSASFVNDSDLRSVAVDSETMGLMPHRDRLCLIQLMKNSSDECHIVQFDNFNEAINLKNLFENENVLKIFHYARFDMTMIYRYLGVMIKNVYCTKIASKLARTYTGAHNLITLCRELLGVDLVKEQTCTDWGRDDITEAQKQYAAHDVLYLHRIMEALDVILAREKRSALAKQCFDFLEARALFDLMIGDSYDIFAH
ncbi:MAG: ribonuclease D [Holosporales bacterium]|jgi:ribonuclease D|nr:ribonuclease D [Holosporales bacterium]